MKADRQIGKTVDFRELKKQNSDKTNTRTPINIVADSNYTENTSLQKFSIPHILIDGQIEFSAVLERFRVLDHL